jgi:DNA ligase-1
MKPMLAEQADLTKLKYPVLASPKLDGVRGLVLDGVLKSRSLKPVPNPFVTKRFSKGAYNGLDGELILGSATATDVYRVTNGACQRETGEPDVKFYVFDRFSQRGGFLERWTSLIDLVADDPNILIVDQRLVENEKELLEYEQEQLDKGFEGLILRAKDAPYKFGRSGVREGYMLKLKRFEDSEAVVVDTYEEMHNGNEAKKNELGRTERSTAQAGLVGKGRLGGLVVKDDKNFPGVTFEIGTGFNAADRTKLWKGRRKLPGQLVKYKYFSVGVKDKPRHPVYLGPRAEWDL